MSQAIYMKILSHIVTDSEQAACIAKSIAGELNSFIKSVYGENADETSWQTFSHKAEEECENIVATFYEVVSSQPYEVMDKILSVINTLQNGSFGMLLADSDYGVVEHKCYGNAQFCEISPDKATGWIWSTDDTLCLEKHFSTEKLTELLDCDEDSVYDEVEEQGDKLIPEIVNEIYPDADDELLEFCEAEEMEDGSTIVRCMLAVHDHDTEQLLAWKDAFENGKLTGWTLRLSESEEENESFENTMICPDANAVMIMTTGSGKLCDFCFWMLNERK